MASKLLRNPLTDKRNRKKAKDQETDALAIEKAAAWAWHQRSSGSEGKTSTRESRTMRTQRHHKPSRYKLEAIRTTSSQVETDEGSYANKLTLLDAYEVRSILMRLDGVVAEPSHDKLGNGLGSASASIDSNGGGRMKKKKKKKKKKKVIIKGLWERHGVLCCTKKEDVVEGRRGMRESQIQVSPKCVPAVKRSMRWAKCAL